MWLWRVQLPGAPGGVWRIAPRTAEWESALGDPVARWPIQGRAPVSELLDVGGWLDVAEELARSLVPDLPNFG